jgi:murein DD-endopeptidase MepM/ murein hydrolase activator NlpD
MQENIFINEKDESKSAVGTSINTIRGRAGLLIVFAALLLLSGCGYYVTVESGETLFSISKKYDLTINDLLEANPSIKDPTKIYVGEKIRIPRDKSLHVAKEERGQPTPAPQKTESVATSSKQSKTEKSETKTKKDKDKDKQKNKDKESSKDKAKTSTTSVANANTSAAKESSTQGSQVRFVWPLTGTIIRYYGKGADGRINDGIDIASSVGQKVVAAADGEVIISDDRLKGYGNMVVIQHAGKYVTLYAHNRVNLVQKGDTVKQGQVIAEVGDTGRANMPHLHFEVRRETTSLDPLTILPK